MLPFVGNGVLCTLDSDGDSYPDEPLSSCLVNDIHLYCIKVSCDNHRGSKFFIKFGV